MKVDVYRNLHQQVWSIRHRGRVLTHAPSVVIHDAKFIVQQAGRLRVLQEKRKNVHAFVRGFISEQMELPFLNSHYQEVTYNPYLYSTFVDLDLNPIFEAKLVILTNSQKCYILKESI